MLVVHKRKRYEVSFKHEEHDFVLPKRKKASSITEKRMVTTCTITCGKRSWTGEAMCRPPDQFGRPEGRKRALKRAVIALTGPRKKETLAFVRGPEWMDLVGWLRARNGLPESKSPYVRTFVPQKGVLELRRAIWKAYFAHMKRGHRLPRHNGAGVTLNLPPPLLSAKQLKGICDAAASKRKLPPITDFE